MTGAHAPTGVLPLALPADRPGLAELPVLTDLEPSADPAGQAAPAGQADPAAAQGLATAQVRTRVQVPLSFPDGYRTTATVVTFAGLLDGREHLALALGDWEGAVADPSRRPLVRPHSECLTGDVFGSERCDCGPQLREAVERIAEVGGFLLYLRQEGRGIGLYAKLDAYALQDAGLDTYQANVALGRGEDERDYTAAAQMLRCLGVDRLALLSNNPDKARQLAASGVQVDERVPTGVHQTLANTRYLTTKRDHTAHTLQLPVGAAVFGTAAGGGPAPEELPLPRRAQEGTAAGVAA